MFGGHRTSTNNLIRLKNAKMFIQSQNEIRLQWKESLEKSCHGTPNNQWVKEGITRDNRAYLETNEKQKHSDQNL